MSRIINYEMAGMIAGKPDRRASRRSRILMASVTLLSVAGLFAQTTKPASAGHAMGPLEVHPANSHYFMRPDGKAVFLTGSHTWNDFQDMGTSTTPTPIDFHDYVKFLKAHGHNATILWKKDLPTDCGWGAGGIWYITPFPWERTGGPGGKHLATDGLAAFDLTKFNQAYFDRLRARAVELQQNGIYAIVQLFDGLQLTSSRCRNDGYPLTRTNNVNGVDDGYRGGQTGVNSFTMTATNVVVGYQEAYVKKVIDTLNDLPNVLWEVSEEAPTDSPWWQNHMIGFVRTYEAGGTWDGKTYPGKPLQHTVGLGDLQCPGNGPFLYGTTADWIAPSMGCTAPAVVSPDNQGHVVLNDSDHSYYFTQFVDATGKVLDQKARNYIWNNFTKGAPVLFMEPYRVNWAPNVRNVCPKPVNGLCPAPDPKYDNLRDNLGYTLRYADRMNLPKMKPAGDLASTGSCLANASEDGAEYLVYAPVGGSFTVNLSATHGSLKVEWFDPSTGKATPGGTVEGGSSAQSFKPPFAGDAILYLVRPAPNPPSRPARSDHP
jgi:hypothetical protein